MIPSAGSAGRGLALAIGLAACAPAPSTLPANTAREGVSIAVYGCASRRAGGDDRPDRSDRDEPGEPGERTGPDDRAERARDDRAGRPDDRADRDTRAGADDACGDAYALIDDRRWVEVAGGALAIDRLDPGAALQSLVIEPMGDGALEIGVCARDDVPAEPVLRCAARGQPGRYLVRLLYVSSVFDYRAEHDVTVTAPDRATVASRFAIATPAWHGVAELTVFEGWPGSEPPPRALARGAIPLDGRTAVVRAPARSLPAQLLRIYEGGPSRAPDPESRELGWRHEPPGPVWVWLALGRASLAAGPVHVHVALPGDELRDLDVAADRRRDDGRGLRLPLWIDPQLVGKRDRFTEPAADTTLTEKLVISIDNAGDTARDVWIEERLRPARRRHLARAWPGAASVDQRSLRMKLTVPPGKPQVAGFEIHYER